MELPQIQEATNELLEKFQALDAVLRDEEILPEDKAGLKKFLSTKATAIAQEMSNWAATILE